MPLDSLYTHVINLTGKTKTFGFLGKHGMRLAANEQVTVPGDLRQTISQNARKFAAMESVLDDNKIAIVKTPPPLLYDEDDDNVKVLSLSNATLGISDPEWGLYSSSGQSPYT